MSVSVVLPTYNRATALPGALADLLALEGVAEIVVVDDGSTDATSHVLAQRAHPRMRVVRAPDNEGAPAARNRGVAAARGEWILFAEDDCRFPADFARVLREEAEAHDAQGAGAPMVHPRGGPLAPALAAARARGAGDGGLDDVAGFPPATLHTPLLPAPSLVSRALAARVRFDPGYRGNAYREETDFFLRARAAGARLVLTPRTYFWEAGRYPGGQARPRLAAEWWTVRNNWRFLRRHEEWLREAGLVASPAREQLAFTGRRLGRLLGETAGRGRPG